MEKKRMEFAGKVVLVTGAASGIGKHFSQSFLQEGSKVCLCDINIANLNETTEEFIKRFGKENVAQSHCDVGKDEDVEDAFDHCEKILGTVNIMINNAGIVNEQNWKDTVNINLGGVIRGCELALKRLGKHNGGKGGHIVNTASIVGFSPFPYLPFYAASKAGIVFYTINAGNEFHYNYTGVLIQCLCPSVIATPILVNEANFPYTPQTKDPKTETLASVVPLTPQEVTDALFKLISEKKTGVALVVKKGKEPHYLDPSVLSSA